MTPAERAAPPAGPDELRLPEPGLALYGCCCHCAPHGPRVLHTQPCLAGCRDAVVPVSVTGGAS